MLPDISLKEGPAPLGPLSREAQDHEETAFFGLLHDAPMQYFGPGTKVFSEGPYRILCDQAPRMAWMRRTPSVSAAGPG
jgi:hypothetical protein